MLQTITSGTPTIYLSYDLLLCFLMICYLVKLVALWRGAQSKEAPWSLLQGHSGETEHTLLWRSVIRSQPDRWRHHWCRCFDWLLFCDAVKIMKLRMCHSLQPACFWLKNMGPVCSGCRYDARKVHLLVWLIKNKATKAYKGADVYIQVLITLRLRGGQWVAPLPAPYSLGNSHRHTFKDVCC